MKRLLSLTAALFVALITAPSFAQNGTPIRIRGTVDAFSGSTLDVTSRTGEKVSVALAPDATVTLIAPAKITDIKSGSFIG
ncbi:MAG: hypothetical protein JO255_07465, partial [Alphaproteobacteria bacterium]|nr:hypothetical protein [Alphaproteobacteria bacterium]